MQQYFSNNKEDNVLKLNFSDIHHIKNVMRMKSGDKIIVVYDKISYKCILNDDYLSATIIEKEKENTETTEITAFIPLLNEEKMSFIIEKGTEMGVTKFIPVQFLRSKFLLNKDKEQKKLDRWNKIAKEASEQSRRLIIPEVTNVINVKDVYKVEGVNILCSLDKENVKEVNKVLNINTICDRISLVFGPEGGITKEEESILTGIGFTKTSLGRNVLRTETVIIVVCSIINYLNG